MGRYAGWIALEAGLAAAADVILVPEIPYDVDRVVASLERRRALGRTYSMMVIAEGAVPTGGGVAVLKKGDATQQERLGGAGQRLSDAITARTGYEARVTVLGHLLRGGTPCAFDRVLATRFGVKAVDLIADGRTGEVAVIRGGKVISATVEEAVDKLKLIDPESDLVRAARATGVELGG
jgi:6-phosphofructokinase